MSICSHEITKQAFNLITLKKTKCIQGKACQMTRYTSIYKAYKKWSGDKPAIMILFDTPEVEYYHTYISYDFLTFVGEVGGILGLTLGASAMSLSEYLLKNVPYY